MTSESSVLLAWDAVRDGTASAGLSRLVRLRGWLSRPDFAGHHLLTMEPPCCAGCGPGSGGIVRVEGAELPDGRLVELEGCLDRTGPTWVLRSARRTDAGFGRRRLLAAAPLLCLAAAAPATEPDAVLADA